MSESYNLDARLLAYYTFHPARFLEDSSGITGSLRASNPPPEPGAGSMPSWPGQTVAILPPAQTESAAGAFFQLPPLRLPEQFSICLWHRSASQSEAWEYIYDFGNGAPRADVALSRRGAPAALRYQIFSGALLVASFQFLISSPAAGWVHTCLRLGPTGVATAFLNSLPAQSAVLAARRDAAVLYSALVGRSNWWNRSRFAGERDELRVYRRALSAAEIRAVFAYRGDGAGSVMPVPCPPLGEDPVATNESDDASNEDAGAEYGWDSGSDLDASRRAQRCCLAGACFESCPEAADPCAAGRNGGNMTGGAICLRQCKTGVRIACQNGEAADCGDGVYYITGLLAPCQIWVEGGLILANWSLQSGCAELNTATGNLSVTVPPARFACAGTNVGGLGLGVVQGGSPCQLCPADAYSFGCGARCEMQANCSGHGRCVGRAEACRCFQGWLGGDCSVRLGDECRRDSDCGGPPRGVCGANLRCVCSGGYTGTRCEQCAEGARGDGNRCLFPTMTPNSARYETIPGLEILGFVRILLPTTILGVPSTIEESRFQLPTPFEAVKIVVPAGVWGGPGRRSATALTATVFDVNNSSLVAGKACGPAIDLGPRNISLMGVISLSMPCNWSSEDRPGLKQAVFLFDIGSGWTQSETLPSLGIGSPIWVRGSKLVPYQAYWVVDSEGGGSHESAINAGVVIGALIGGGSLLAVAAVIFLTIRRHKARLIHYAAFSVRSRLASDSACSKYAATFDGQQYASSPCTDSTSQASRYAMKQNSVSSCTAYEPEISNMFYISGTRPGSQQACIKFSNKGIFDDFVSDAVGAHLPDLPGVVSMDEASFIQTSRMEGRELYIDLKAVNREQTFKL